MVFAKKKDRKISISFMLTLSIFVTIFIASSLSIFVSYIKAKEDAKTEIQKEIEKTLTDITDILKMPLWTYDLETIEDVGRLYSKNEAIVKLKIVDSLGKTLFKADKRFKGNNLKRTRKVIHGKKTAGTVEIAISSEKYEEYIKQLVFSGSFTVLINLVVLVAITGFFLRRFLNHPLQRLSEIVNLYDQDNYDQKDFHMEYREFVPVVEVIKSMGTKINSQIDDLKHARRKYRDIFENSVEGIFQIGRDQRFIAVNQAFADIYGYKSPEELIDGEISKGFFKDDGSLSEMQKVLDEQGILNMAEFEGKNINDELLWLSVSARAVKGPDGETLYYEGSLKDISHIKEKEDAKRKQKEADAANQAKTLFIANMSHEIRTPLNSVLGMVELLKETECSEDQKEYIDILESSGEFLQVIINDILDLSKIEAEQLDLEEIPFDLNSILDDVINIVSPENRKLDIVKHLEREIDTVLVGDPVRLRQILINLAGNAVKFTKEGSVRVEAYPSKISEDKLKVEFRIKDTGIGIDETKIRKIFETFSQADQFTNRQYGGTGLGLAISKRLVSMMGGELEVKSKVNEGSVFYFTLSFEISDVKINTDQTSEQKGTHKIPPLKILLADDIHPNRTVIHKFLAPFPVSFTDAEDGAKALELYKNGNFDLVLMDVEMPVMNGLDATSAIRKWEEEVSIERTPLIIISAHAFGEQKKECFEAGCDRLLIKPVRKNELINTIYGLFSNDVEIEIEESTEKEKVREDECRQCVYVDEIFEDLMPEFFSYFNESLETMEKALGKKDFKDLERLGHGLKGSSRNYELIDLGNIFLEIEKAAKDRKPQNIYTKMHEAKEYIKKVKVEFVNRD